MKLKHLIFITLILPSLTECHKKAGLVLFSFFLTTRGSASGPEDLTQRWWTDVQKPYRTCVCHLKKGGEYQWKINPGIYRVGMRGEWCKSHKWSVLSIYIKLTHILTFTWVSWLSGVGEGRRQPIILLVVHYTDTWSFNYSVTTS